jgi:hypothetical protein
MTGTEDFLTAGLDHDNLKVDAEDPDPRPMTPFWTPGPA